MKHTFARPALYGLLTGALTLTACSSLQGDKVDYKSATKAPSLEIPPDLTKIASETRYSVPGSSAVSASGYQVRSASELPAAASSMGDVKVERMGNQRWLVVSRSPDQLWEPVKSFWKDSGFVLLVDERNLGIMETDWAENRAKIPQDFIRNTIGKVLDSLYSTSERDKFRTRLERTPSGGTEIFISHRGMQEINKGSSGNTDIVWGPRPADPELETEFLRRLMIKLGATTVQAEAVVAAPAAKPTSRTDMVNNQPVAVLDDGFDRAWRRVGLSLDRNGFTVEDRDRSQGVYFVRYVEPKGDEKEPGFFSRIFSSSKPKAPVKYRILVKPNGSTSVVSVLNETGSPETSEVAKQIVDLLVADLK